MNFRDITKLKFKLYSKISTLLRISKIRSRQINTVSTDDASDNAIHELTIWYIFCILLSFLMGLFISIIPSIFTSLGKDIKDDWVLSMAVPIFASFICFLFAREMHEKIITKQIKFIAKIMKAQHLKKLEKSSNNNFIIKEQMLLHYAYFYMANEESNRRDIILRASQIHGNECNPADVEPDLKKRFANEQIRKKLGVVITSIKEESWNLLATASTLDTFNFDSENSVHREELENGRKLLFCQDIYVYLSVWLVSSIDNNIPGAMPYMPVKVIGLHYPDTKAPDINAYEIALSYLIKAFDQGNFVMNFSHIQELSPEQIKICKEISPYLKKLIQMLKDFVRDFPENSLS